MTRKKLTIGMGSIAFVAVLVWFLYPREKSRVRFEGTAPNPHNLSAIRPRIKYQQPPLFSKSATLFIDETPINDQELVLKRHQKVRIHGELSGGPIPKGDMIVGVELFLTSHSKNSFGYIMEGMTDLTRDPFLNLGNDGSYQGKFDTTWTVPDHAGEFNLELVMEVLKPELRIVPRHHIIVCPVRVE